MFGGGVRETKDENESLMVCGKTWFNMKKERIILQESQNSNGMSYGIWKKNF